MNTLALEVEPIATRVSVTDDELTVELTDGRRIVVPLAWYPRLLHASATERRNWQLLGDGYAIEWAELDEHIGIEGLLAGRSSGESQKSLSRWLAARQVKSTRKTRAKRAASHLSRRTVARRTSG